MLGGRGGGDGLLVEKAPKRTTCYQPDLLQSNDLDFRRGESL
jgi:hypothetical protein